MGVDRLPYFPFPFLFCTCGFDLWVFVLKVALPLDNILEYKYNILEGEGKWVKNFCTNDLPIVLGKKAQRSVTCYSLLSVSRQGSTYTIVPKVKPSISMYLIDCS